MESDTAKLIELKRYPLTFAMIFTGLASFIGGSFIFGWNITSLSVPAPYIKNFMNESVYDRYDTVLEKSQVDFLFSLAIMIFNIGGAVGAFFSGKLADEYGRKKSILALQSLVILGAIFHGVCQRVGSFELLLIARFVVGLGSGGCLPIVPMYANEIAPAHLRGAAATGSQLFITLGILASTIFVLEDTLGSAEWWPTGAASMLIFSIIAIVMLSSSLCVESPKWLINIRNDDEAGKEALRRLYDRPDIEEIFEEIKSESTAAKGAGSDGGEEWGFLRLLRTNSLRWPVFFVVALNVAQQCSGINVVFFFASSLYSAAGLTGKMVSYAALAVSAVNVMATILAVRLIDQLGRRPLLIFPMVGMVFAMILETFFLAKQAVYPWMSSASIGCMVIYVIFFAVGLGPIPLFIGAELLPPEPRASAMALGGVVNLVLTILIALLFENVLVRYLDTYSMCPFILLTAVFIVIFWKALPETKDRTVAEIYRELGTTATQLGLPGPGEMEEGRVLLLAADKTKLI